MSPLQEEDIRNKMAYNAYRYRYEGNWKLLDELVRLEQLIPGIMIDVIIEQIGPHAFYGNVVRLMKKNVKLIKQKTLFLADKRLVKRSNRKRGHTDLGKLPKQHQVPKSREIKEREKFLPIQVTHPYWYSQVYGEERNRQAQETILRSHSFTDQSLTEDSEEIKFRRREKKRLNQLRKRKDPVKKLINRAYRDLKLELEVNEMLQTTRFFLEKYVVDEVFLQKLVLLELPISEALLRHLSVYLVDHVVWISFAQRYRSARERSEVSNRYFSSKDLR